LSGPDLGLVLLSALLHALWSLAIKGSRSPLGFNVLQLVPTAIAACALPWLVPLAELPGSIWALAAGTGVAHGLYFYWLSRALAAGQLSIVYPIARSAPAFVPLVAVPLLGEPVSAGGALGIAVVVAGMWAVQVEAGAAAGRAAPGPPDHRAGRAAPGPPDHRAGRAAPGPPDRPTGWRRLLVAPGAGWAWLTLAASVGYSLVDKMAMARLGELPWRGAVPPAIAWYVILCTSGMVVFVPLALRHVRPRALAEQARHEWRTALLAAAVGLVGYGLILHALRTAPVSYVVAVRQASVLFAVALGVLRLRERPTRLRLVGALATVVGVALVAAS
jgi:drug/metabolite transporter (DMT)-like permease